MVHRHSSDPAEDQESETIRTASRMEPDGSCLLEVFAEGFPVGTEDIRLPHFDHLQRDVVHCCEIGFDCRQSGIHIIRKIMFSIIRSKTRPIICENLLSRLKNS